MEVVVLIICSGPAQGSFGVSAYLHFVQIMSPYKLNFFSKIKIMRGTMNQRFIIFTFVQICLRE